MPPRNIKLYICISVSCVSNVAVRSAKVLDSRIWVHRLKKKIVEAKDRDEAVWLTVKS